MSDIKEAQISVHRECRLSLIAFGAAQPICIRCDELECEREACYCKKCDASSKLCVCCDGCKKCVNLCICQKIREAKEKKLAIRRQEEAKQKAIEEKKKKKREHVVSDTDAYRDLEKRVVLLEQQTISADTSDMLKTIAVMNEELVLLREEVAMLRKNSEKKRRITDDIQKEENNDADPSDDNTSRQRRVIEVQGFTWFDRQSRESRFKCDNCDRCMYKRSISTHKCKK